MAYSLALADQLSGLVPSHPVGLDRSLSLPLAAVRHI